MKWIKFKDKIPKLNTQILLYDLEELNFPGEKFKPGILIRPYDKDKKFNPDYYFFKYMKHDFNISNIQLIEMPINENWYFMEIEKPNG